MNIKRENKYDTFSNYKTAQNFANVTHANTTSGQFHIPNTASAPHLYLLFHKKKFSLPILAGSSGGNNCIVLSHMIILALTSSHTCTDTLYTNTQDIYTSHKVLYTHVHTHTHIPSLGFVADFKPEPTFLFYTSPWHPEKYCLFSKNSLSLPPLFPYSFFLLSFFSTFTTLPNVSFLIDLK